MTAAGRRVPDRELEPGSDRWRGGPSDRFHELWRRTPQPARTKHLTGTATGHRRAHTGSRPDRQGPHPTGSSKRWKAEPLARRHQQQDPGRGHRPHVWITGTGVMTATIERDQITIPGSSSAARLRRALVAASDVAAVIGGVAVGRALTPGAAPSAWTTAVFGLLMLISMVSFRLYSSRLATVRTQELARVGRSGIWAPPAARWLLPGDGHGHRPAGRAVPRRRHHHRRFAGAGGAAPLVRGQTPGRSGPVELDPGGFGGGGDHLPARHRRRHHQSSRDRGSARPGRERLVRRSVDQGHLPGPSRQRRRGGGAGVLARSPDREPARPRAARRRALRGPVVAPGRHLHRSAGHEEPRSEPGHLDRAATQGRLARKALPKALAEKLVDMVPASSHDKLADVVDATLASFVEQEEQESRALSDELLREIRTGGMAVVGPRRGVGRTRKSTGGRVSDIGPITTARTARRWYAWRKRRAAGSSWSTPANRWSASAESEPCCATATSKRESMGDLSSLGLEWVIALDGLNRLFALVVIGIGAVVLVYASAYFSERRDFVRFFPILLLFAASMARRGAQRQP